MGAFLTREVAEILDSAEGDEKSMVQVIERLRDEITVLSVRGHQYGSRELSFLLGKLDEAKMWAVEYGTKNGAYLLVDKRDYKRQLELTAETDTTEPTETKGTTVNA